MTVVNEEYKDYQHNGAVLVLVTMFSVLCHRNQQYVGLNSSATADGRRPIVCQALSISGKVRRAPANCTTILAVILASTRCRSDVNLFPAYSLKPILTATKFGTTSCHRNAHVYNHVDRS